MKRRNVLRSLGAIGLSGSVWPALRASADSSRDFDVVVIGAGVFGVWTALHLNRLGKRVAVIEAVAPAHSRASSGGESRVTRCGYGDAEIYTEWACRSVGEWQTLSDRAVLPLFHQTGVLWLHGPGDSYVSATAPVLEKHRIPFERLDRDALKARYPVLNIAAGEAGFLEPQSGGLMARRAVQTLAAELKESGVEFMHGKVLPIASADSNSAALPFISLTDGTRIRGSRFVFACGPWLDKVCPEAMAGRLFVTRQDVHYFAADRHQTGQLPVWADLPYYGLPSLEGRGFKVANDTHGVAIEPDTLDRHSSAVAEADAREFLARRFPSIAESPLVESRVCQYENSSNGDFVIDKHPGMDNVWLAGCGSGHGFKHGPAVGDYVAKLLYDNVMPIDRFSLASKSTAHRREVQ